MKEEHFFYVPDAVTAQQLSEEEAKHAVRVLRLKEGDPLFLTDGVGNFYHAVVTEASNKHCRYSIQEVLPQQPIWQGHIHLAMAPTKMMDRVEWFVEKATEIGIDEFSFLSCRFSERKVIRLDRVEKIILSAVKQSKKAWVPVVHEMVDFKAFIDSHPSGMRFIAHCYEEIPKVDLYATLCQCELPPQERDITVLIGPEGDFSVDEVQYAISKGFTSISLGAARLRTETAALVAVMTASICQRI